jgi:hypothetical protein
MTPNQGVALVTFAAKCRVHEERICLLFIASPSILLSFHDEHIIRRKVPLAYLGVPYVRGAMNKNMAILGGS